MNHILPLRLLLLIVSLGILCFIENESSLKNLAMTATVDICEQEIDFKYYFQ